MSQVLDGVLGRPGAIFAFSALLLLTATYLGAHAEQRWRPLKKEEEELLKMVLGGTLTLLGLIVGFTFSMAISRYDQRKNLEEEEANAIGTEFSRAELLPAAATEDAKRLLRSYLDLRIAFYRERSEGELARIDAQTAAVQAELWSVVRSAALTQPTPVIALAAAGMNDVLNSQGYTQAAWWNRIPDGAWALMMVIAISCSVLIGYSAHVKRRPLLVILPFVLATAFFFIADIDNPRHGLIQVVPRNLISVSEGLRPARADARVPH